LREHVSNIKQVTNLIWLVVGIMNSKSIALSQLANLMPGETEAESRVTRIREWLKNSKVEVWTLYQAVLREVLRDWHDTTMSLIVDGTLVFGGRLQIFRLSLAHGNRAIPLAWMVVPGTGLVQAERLRPMFRQVAEFLMRYQARITLLADRGFRDHDWAVLCKDRGWSYRIRIVRSTHIRLRTGATVRLDALKPRMGRTLCLSHVLLTQQHAFATHVSMTWTRGEDNVAPELVIVISDQRAHPDRLREYAVRMDIEQSFRDDKSGGFDIDHTRLSHPERLERLLLAVAIATVWCHEVGQFVLLTGEVLRRLIDPAHTRHLSIFQLGLRWIKRCLAVLLDSLPDFYARLLPLVLPPISF
jgi:Transposase DDE domain